MNFLIAGEVSTREVLDRESKPLYELVAEARDQGRPSRSARVPLRILVSDVNDNAPDIIDPQEDVVSVREEQPPGTEVVRIRAVDRDAGPNASVTYSILKGREADGWGVFSVDPVTGVLRTRAVLDHAERPIYRVTVAASDSGTPHRQSVRTLRVEVLALNDNRPTFSSSSLHFKVREDVPVGYVVGNVVNSESPEENLVSVRARGGHVMYTLTSISPTDTETAFDMDRSSGSLVVARRLDRETCPEYRLEVRALDTSTTNNPQSSAVVVRVEITDVNDNTPRWDKELVTFEIAEDAPVGSAAWNFSATDADAASNGEVRYGLVSCSPCPRHSSPTFAVDPLTGSLTLLASLDYEKLSEYTVVVRVTDQAANLSDRLSASLTARLKVRDVNDNAPQFVSPTVKTVHVKDGTEPGSSLTRVMAVDKDSGEFGRVTYVISAGNSEGRFALGYETGVLTLTRPLEPSAMYTVNVTASDHASPAKHSTISLIIVVQGSTESPLRFHSPEYHANISEDASIGAFVVRVQAKSGDMNGGNVTYSLGGGSDGLFRVDPVSGVVSVVKSLDRETKWEYVFPVYGEEEGRYDTAVIRIRVTDTNDHAPTFPACYTLSLPENSDFAVIHRLSAYDPDSGPNGELTYSITGGNSGNRFSIDLRTGEVSARALDRESQWQYHLVISAQDGPGLRGLCNLTVIVADENDNRPEFGRLAYSGSVREDAPPGTPVLTVTATDPDSGLNARLVYSIANESHWLFAIDNRTGVISTVGNLDRERQSVFEFQVVATDGGRYDARSHKVPVRITVEDVNDNKPVFSDYPFTAEVPGNTQPGQDLLRVTATDADQGPNADVVYSFFNQPPNNKFRINPKSGVITASSGLAMESGRLFHLQLVATDKGNPPQSSTGLVEIKVGDGPEGAPTLRFQNSSYIVQLPENAEVGTDVVQVSAVRTDGRRQKILYRFGSGNEDGKFEINGNSGQIRVLDSAKLDYEVKARLRLNVVAEAEVTGGPPLYGYTQVWVHLLDQNDSPPRFTQPQYTAAVWEGNNKGTYVMQVSATDVDQGPNARLLYHIVDGNHDNAFVIEPPFSGIVKTNIVLDREIRDSYRLTVIATDEGIPQLTGTSTIRINIVDVNDNQPTFPPHSVISVKEGKEVGSVLTSVTANDVDTNPTITYNLSDSDGYFSIDRFSGKVTLCHELDYETRQEYRLHITASDTAHTAQTVLTVKVIDDNDNTPKFIQPSYQATLPVSATDADSGQNAELRYSFVNPVTGFTIDENTGVITANRTAISMPVERLKVIDLLVKVTDSGRHPLSSITSVRVKVDDYSAGKSHFSQNEYRISAKENAGIGTSLLKMAPSTIIETSMKSHYNIIDGNKDATFQILSPHGELILVKSLDREVQDLYTLKVTYGPDNTTAATVIITVEDANDNAPQFVSLENSVTISEGVPVGHVLLQLKGTDDDLPPNSDIQFDITSGNDEDLFQVDSLSGLLSVKNKLDYDLGIPLYSLVVRATDSAREPEFPLSTLATIKIILEDENDNTPQFPVLEYLEFVGENEAIGSTVFTARATDMDRGIYGKLNYSIESAAATGYTDIDDSWKLFKVDSYTGLVTTNTVFDYEARSRYAFTLITTDTGGKKARVRVRVEIESRDEFHPQFTERTYRFVVTGSDLPVGSVVGNVIATDRDKGPDGRVVYQLSNQHVYFKVNRTTGAVMIKKKLDNGLDTNQEVSFVVTASSGRQGSLTNMTVVEISFDPLAGHETNLVNPEEGGNNTALAASTGNRRNKKVNKPSLGAGQSTDNFVDPGAFDTIPIRGGVAGPASQFGPPKYEDIPTYRNNKSSSSNSGAATTSQISGSDQSGSSGRGSAEDGDDVEDEEIRMINEGIQREAGLNRTSDDNMSDVSVQNTQEYLARLGIVNTKGGSGGSRRHTTDSVGAGSSKDIMLHAGVPIDELHMFDEDAPEEADITNLIYAKLTDVSGSDRASSAEDGNGSTTGALGAAVDHVMGMGAFGSVPNTHQPSMTGSLSSIVHSEEELTGSYNWDYLLDWGPQYQPLAHVFSEIARLKDDAASVKSGTSGASSGKGKCPPPVAKSLPPPLLTSVAPRSIAAPVLSARSTHHPSVPHQTPKMHVLPRSPINHDGTGAVFGSSAAMSPSFSPALSPLATSPSLSPMVTPRLPSSHHVRQRTTDAELRI
ncbi:hypothetical protein AAG570_006401 [Ranatra chinensis]|uniref:Cadherin domain-containing protein n=1 Tax=Ranatra chinensis TaxID=642074 RepID=A0ABD0Z6P3_9HEMI